MEEVQSDDEYHNRAIFEPMRQTLRVYDEECRRGIVHTDPWDKKMEEFRRQLEEKGWTI